MGRKSASQGEIFMRRSILLLSAGLAVLSAGTALAQNSTPHNMILFIPDGLRALKVTPETAPAMAEVRDRDVNFKNPHSLFPTFTMANASGMATGHYLGDTGTFSNTIYTGYPSAPAGDTVVPFIENDAVLADVDEHFGGDYLNEETILKMARGKGFSTAAIGKVGPTLLFDHTDRADRPGLHSIVIDDSTGGKNGVPLSEEMKAALTKAGLPATTPSRGDNGKSGDAKTPGTLVPNTAQQAYFADVASKVVMPMFKERKKPFVLVFWSRDPDGTQHNMGDSLNTLTPGINGPTSLASIKNADNNLAQLRRALDDLGLAATTNIMIAADHGFSTISKESKTSPAAKASYEDTPRDFLPMGFLSIDLAKALNLPLFDPNDKSAHCRKYPSQVRKRRARAGSRKARSGGRHQRRIGPDLPAEQGQETRGTHGQGPARTGLCQRVVRRRQARTLPRHAAVVAAQPQGQGGDAYSFDRGQFPFLRDRM